MPTEYLRSIYGNDAFAVTPSDTALLTDSSGNTVQGRLYVGGAGNIALVTSLGTSVSFTAVPAGTYIDVLVGQVKATGTTATNIVAIYTR